MTTSELELLLTEAALAELLPKPRRCPYCGVQTKGDACSQHTDLILLDEDWREHGDA